MTPAELNEILGRIKMLHMHLAILANVTPRTVHNWISGKLPIPRPVAILIRAIDEGHIADEWLFDQIGTS